MEVGDARVVSGPVEIAPLERVRLGLVARDEVSDGSVEILRCCGPLPVGATSRPIDDRRPSLPRLHRCIKDWVVQRFDDAAGSIERRRTLNTAPRSADAHWVPLDM